MSNYFHSKSQKNRKSMISLGGEKKLFLNLIYSANFLKLKNIGGGGVGFEFLEIPFLVTKDIKFSFAFS